MSLSNYFGVCAVLLPTSSERSRRTTFVWRTERKVSGLYARTHSRLRGSFHVAGMLLSSSSIKYHITSSFCQETMTEISNTIANAEKNATKVMVKVKGMY